MKVVWLENINYESMQELFVTKRIHWALIENNTRKVLLATDEEVDGDYFAMRLLDQGINNWHVLSINLDGRISREEPEDRYSNWFKHA